MCRRAFGPLGPISLTSRKRVSQGLPGGGGDQKFERSQTKLRLQLSKARRSQVNTDLGELHRLPSGGLPRMQKICVKKCWAQKLKLERNADNSGRKFSGGPETLENHG